MAALGQWELSLEMEHLEQPGEPSQTRDLGDLALLAGGAFGVCGIFNNFPLSFSCRSITCLSSDQKLTVLLGGLSQHVTIVDESRVLCEHTNNATSLCVKLMSLLCLCRLTAFCTAGQTLGRTGNEGLSRQQRKIRG